MLQINEKHKKYSCEKKNQKVKKTSLADYPFVIFSHQKVILPRNPKWTFSIETEQVFNIIVIATTTFFFFQAGFITLTCLNLEWYNCNMTPGEDNKP